MKLFYLAAAVVLCAFLSFSACSNGTQEGADTVQQTTPPPTTTTPIAPPNNTTPPVTTNNAGQAAFGVPHYICASGCKGGTSDTAGNCPVCGKPMEHNQAYHSQPNAQPDAAATTPNTPPPAQNAKGVYHYICSKGCSGGAAGAGNCATCGEALAHNPEYHNN